MATGLQKESWLVEVPMPLAPLVCPSVEEAARNHLWAACSSDVVSGGHHEPVGVGGKEAGMAMDDVLCERLWEWTETELENGQSL